VAVSTGGSTPGTSGCFPRLRHRALVALVSVAVMLSTIPLYGLIRLDYLPANADEGSST